MTDEQPTEWLSQEAYDRLQAELEERRSTGREEAASKIEVARGHGDLRENAEYHAAKEEQGQNEARIRQLEEKLRHARIGSPPVAEGVVAGGMIVTITDDGDDERTFLLGSREDRHRELDVVSTQSPLGRALDGAKVGDTVTYQAPAGSFAVTVKAVRPQEA